MAEKARKAAFPLPFVKDLQQVNRVILHGMLRYFLVFASHYKGQKSGTGMTGDLSLF